MKKYLLHALLSLPVFATDASPLPPEAFDSPTSFLTHTENMIPLPGELYEALGKSIMEALAKDDLLSQFLKGGPGLTRESAWQVEVFADIIEYLPSLAERLLSKAITLDIKNEVSNGRCYTCISYGILLQEKRYSIEQWFDYTLSMQKYRESEEVRKLEQKSDTLLAHLADVKSADEPFSKELKRELVQVLGTWMRLPGMPDSFFNNSRNPKSHYEQAIYTELSRLNKTHYFYAIESMPR